MQKIQIKPHPRATGFLSPSNLASGHPSPQLKGSLMRGLLCLCVPWVSWTSSDEKGIIVREWNVYLTAILICTLPCQCHRMLCRFRHIPGKSSSDRSSSIAFTNWVIIKHFKLTFCIKSNNNLTLTLVLWFAFQI